MTNPWTLRAIGLALAAALYFADQWLKFHVYWVMDLHSLGRIEVIPGFFSLTFVPNYGVSLGMFAATSPEMRWGLVAVTALIALVVFVWLLRERRLGDILPLAMILGGAAGNIHDRSNYGYVVDFLDFHFWGWTPFVFNLADAGITIGVAIILVRALFMGEKPPARHGAQQADTPAETN